MRSFTFSITKVYYNQSLQLRTSRMEVTNPNEKQNYTKKSYTFTLLHSHELFRTSMLTY